MPNKMVTDTTYAAPFREAAILEMTNLFALVFQITVADVDVVKTSKNTGVRNLCAPLVHRVMAVKDVTISAQSKMLLVVQILG